MADITMCTNTLCPNAATCYRTTANTSERQSMAAFQYTVGEHGVSCDYYWSNFDREVAANVAVSVTGESESE